MAGKKWVGWVAAIAALGIGVQAHAANILINGDFELTTLPGSAEFGSGYPANQVTGWYTDGYNFVFAPGTADTTLARSRTESTKRSSRSISPRAWASCCRSSPASKW